MEAKMTVNDTSVMVFRLRTDDSDEEPQPQPQPQEEICEFPSMLLDDVNWFARKDWKEAQQWTHPPNIAEYIMKSRAGQGIHDDDFIPYPFDDVVLQCSSVIICYQACRYDEIERITHRYEAQHQGITTEDHTGVADEEWDEIQEEALQAHRYIKCDERILSYPDGCYRFTAGELLKHIYRFYASVMATEDMRAVAATNDDWGYSARATKRLADGSVLYREEIMGDCMHFEGLRLIGVSDQIPVYEVMFGS